MLEREDGVDIDPELDRVDVVDDLVLDLDHVVQVVQHNLVLSVSRV